MEITWQGHSAIRLVSGDVALLIDPFPEAPGTPLADIVLVTNDQPNHSAYESVIEDPRLIKGPGQYEVLGYNITGVGTALNDEEGSRRINTVYVIRAEGLVVCHLGNLNTKLTSRQLDSLGSVDILIAPSGGGSTLAPKEIIELVNVLSPGVLIPVHYGEEGSANGLGPVSTFLSEMNVQAPDPQNRLSVTQNNIPREMRVALFQPFVSRRR